MQLGPSTSPAVPDASGMPPQVSEDNRRFARRACKLQAVLTVLDTWDVEFGVKREFEVITRNISRNGICFLLFRQLYPDDRISLDFGELKRLYRVARCRRLAPNCFEVGAAVIG